MVERDLLELVEFCYASVTVPNCWSAFLAACAAAFDATILSIATVQWQPRRMNWVVTHGLGSEYLRELPARSMEDPRAALLGSLKPGRGYLFDEAGHDIAAFKRSPYYTEFQSELDALWAVITRLDEAKGIDGLWTMNRPERTPSFTSLDLRHVEVLARHIGRARRLQVDLQLADAKARQWADLLDHLPVGLVLLTAGQRVIDANRAARMIGEAGDGIGLRGDGLRVADATAGRALAAMIDAAARGALDGVGGVLAVPRPSGAPDYAVSVVRCFPDLAKVVGTDQGTVLVAIADPARETGAGVDVLRRLWQLTGAEARFALAVADGRSVEEVAVHLGITVGTARVHLKRIMAKTGTHRQGELVRLILAGPGSLPRSGGTQG